MDTQQQITTIESVSRRFSDFCNELIKNVRTSNKPLTMDATADVQLENIIATLRTAVPRSTSVIQLVVDSNFIQGLAEALGNGIEQRDSNRLVANQDIVLFAFNGNVRLATYLNDTNKDYYNVMLSKPKQIVLLPVHLNMQQNVEHMYKNMKVINFWSKPVFTPGPKPVNLNDPSVQTWNNSSFVELKTLFNVQIRCNYCEATNNDLLKCGACVSTFYCNIICQRNDWNNHTIYCNKHK